MLINIYQGLVCGIELLQYLVHNRVGEIGNHRELHLPGSQHMETEEEEEEEEGINN